MWRVGAGYTINAFTFNFVYENQEIGDFDVDNYYGASWDADIWQISAAYDFGNNRIKAAYGEHDATMVGEGITFDWTDEAKSTHWAIGLDHKLSKRTTAYAQYAEAKADSIKSTGRLDGQVERVEHSPGGKKNGFSMGLIHNF